MNTETHLHKYRKFKEEGKRAKYPPSKIENYFLSSFQLIEAVVHLKSGKHIQKHQKIRKILESNPFIFKDDTEKVWRSFQDLENRVRVATSYGSRDNGDLLKEAKEKFEIIENLCGDLIEDR